MKATARVASAAALALFLVSPILPLRLSTQTLGGGRGDTVEAAEQRNASAFAIILGEFRTNVSDMIFIKTERYLDSGIAYMPHINTDAMAQSGEIETRRRQPAGHDATTCTDPSHHHDHDHDHDHATSETDHESTDSVAALQRQVEQGLTTAKMREAAALKPGETTGHDHTHEFVDTIIRTAEKDFRGFIGHLERRVKPWRDPRLPHRHTAGTELLPWYRLATMSNPQFVRGYLIGAWWLKKQRTEEQTREALKFIEEGIANNPNAFQLHLMRGHILRALKRDAEALQSFRRAADLGIAQRPRDGKEGPNWTSYNEDDITAAILLSVFIERDTKGREAALTLAREYRSRMETFPPLDRVIRSLEQPTQTPQGNANSSDSP